MTPCNCGICPECRDQALAELDDATQAEADAIELDERRNADPTWDYEPSGAF